MSNSGNIVIQEHGKEAVYLYAHWDGYRLREIARAALERGRDRWDDPPYLARIVFQEMVADDKGTTGFGISASPTSGDHPDLVLDAGTQQASGVHADDGVEWTQSFKDFLSDGAS